MPSLAALLAFSLLVAQDEPSRERIRALVGKLRSDSIEARDAATGALKRIGGAALPALRAAAGDPDAEVSVRAARIAAEIEWSRFVPLWIEARHPDIYSELAGGNGARMAAAYDRMVERGAFRLFLDRKVLRDGPPAMKSRLLYGFSVRPQPAWRVRNVLETLLDPDFEDMALEERDFEALAQGIALHVRAPHREALHTLSALPDPLRKATGILGLASLGDPEARTAALEELRHEAPWRRTAAARAFGRSRDPRAGPLLRDLLSSPYPETILAALGTLEGYPEIGLRKPLVNLLRFKGKSSWERETVQAAALHHLALRKIDEFDIIWSLVKKGVLKEAPAFENRRLSSNSLPYRLAEALLVADDPVILERMETLRKDRWMTWVAFRTAVIRVAPPRIGARLREIAGGSDGASEALVRLAREFVELRADEPPLPPDPMAVLRSDAPPDEKARAFKALSRRPGRDPEFSALCRDWAARKGHPLRGEAAIRLLLWGEREVSADAFLDLVKEGAPGSDRWLWLLKDDERARPFLLERLESRSADVRGNAMRNLALLRDDAVPPIIFKAFRERTPLHTGYGLWWFLRHYRERDFTDELLPFLTEDAPAWQVAQILSYLRWRGRKDQVALVRRFADHGSRARRTAADVLGEWRDRRSFERIEGMSRAAESDWDLEVYLRALVRIDPDRARTRLLEVMADGKRGRRAAAASALAEIADSRDGRLLLRLIRTDEGGDRHTHPAIGRIGCAEAAEPLLELLKAGEPYAAIGLAYLGDRRAVPILLDRLRRGEWASMNALDYLVNRDRYPPLTGRKGDRSARWDTLRFEEARARARSLYRIELTLSPQLIPPHVRFAGGQDLVEWMETECMGRRAGPGFAHLWREGNVELLPYDEARRFWLSWKPQRE